MIAFAFGLVHGFGFSFVAARVDAVRRLAPDDVAAGVQRRRRARPAARARARDPGCWRVLFRYVVAERIGTILLSALVAHTAWHWMLERGAALREYQFEWPAFDVALALGGSG